MHIMASRFAEVMRKAREAKGYTKYRLAKVSGVSDGLLSRFESGHQLPADETIAKLAAALEADADALRAAADMDRLGEDGVARLAERLSGGAKTAPVHDVTELHELKTRNNSLIVVSDQNGINQPSIMLSGDQYDARLAELDSLFDTVNAHYYGRVGCGDAIDVCGEPVGVRPVPRRFVEKYPRAKLGLVEAAGDSMNLANIQPGMMLVVDCSVSPEPGMVVVANVPFQGSVCKRYELRDGKPFLVSESTNNYPPIPVVEGVKISGVVRHGWTVTDF